MAKEIATLPPLAELKLETPLSPRTGEPRRPVVLGIAAAVLYLTVVAVGFSYGWHWYRAAYSETYPISAHLTQWIEPDPGKWLSLTLEFVYAGLALLAAGAAGVTGFQAWNGRRWARLGALIALVLAALQTLLVNQYGYIALGIVAVGGALLFLRPVSRYLGEWDEVRSRQPVRYRRPASVYYGRLPRYR